MSKQDEIINMLSEEFDSRWNPYTFCDIAVKISEIGEKNKSVMQYLAEDEEKKITNNLNEIANLKETNERIKKLIEQNKALEEKRKRLEAEHAELQQKKKQLEELQQKQKELQDNQPFIDSFEENLKQINDNNIDATMADFSRKLTDVQKLLSNNDLGNKLKDIINAVQSNLQKVRQEDVIQCKDDLSELKTEFTRIDKEINAKIEEHNEYATRINGVKKAFNEASEKLKSVQEAYKKHIEQDKNIVDCLTEAGEFEMGSWIKTNLTELDKLLAGIENKIRTTIDEREKFPVCTILERRGTQ